MLTETKKHSKHKAYLHSKYVFELHKILIIALFYKFENILKLHK